MKHKKIITNSKTQHRITQYRFSHIICLIINTDECYDGSNRDSRKCQHGEANLGVTLNAWKLLTSVNDRYFEVERRIKNNSQPESDVSAVVSV